jgi:hypothetical protein
MNTNWFSVATALQCTTSLPRLINFTPHMVTIARAKHVNFSYLISIDIEEAATTGLLE